MTLTPQGFLGWAKSWSNDYNWFQTDGKISLLNEMFSPVIEQKHNAHYSRKKEKMIVFTHWNLYTDTQITPVMYAFKDHFQNHYQM